MAQLTAVIVSADADFRRETGRLLQAGGVPVGIIDERAASNAPEETELVVVDVRGDAPAGLAAIERVRAALPTAAIFAVATGTSPDLILQAMRAGANEFVSWVGADQPSSRHAMEDSFHGAVRRAASRRQATQAETRTPSVTMVFFGAKGGAGTTTVSVNCAVELARITHRPTVIVDLKATLGEVALFLGVQPQFTVLDAVENVHRLDRDFVRGLMARHKSGLDVLAGCEQFERPGPQDASAIEELIRALGKTYDFVVVDGGNVVNSCAVAAFHAAETIYLVANPDVPSIRNAQRLVERVRQLGAGSERVRILLNRFVDHLMIGPQQIESALGYPVDHLFTSDYKAVSTALNSGVPLTLSNHSEISAQFDQFTRRIITPRTQGARPEPEKRRRFFGLRG